MKPEIHKPIRYRHPSPKLCPFCLMNEAIGKTDWGTLGCKFCQATVDTYIESNYEVIQDEKR